MLYDFNNFSSTRRNLLLLNLILILSLFSVQEMSIFNLYFFKIDLSKLPLDLSDIIFIVTMYFFIVYCSFLLNNENNVLIRQYAVRLRKPSVRKPAYRHINKLTIYLSCYTICLNGCTSLIFPERECSVTPHSVL